MYVHTACTCDLWMCINTWFSFWVFELSPFQRYPNICTSKRTVLCLLSVAKKQQHRHRYRRWKRWWMREVGLNSLPNMYSTFQTVTLVLQLNISFTTQIDSQTWYANLWFTRFKFLVTRKKEQHRKHNITDQCMCIPFSHGILIFMSPPPPPPPTPPPTKNTQKNK